ncbi:MAG: hypothetical protein HYX27_02900 [Acidobacteria bacterium]|nr:hypothetical protein [Acidobacteriota bacterium]
MRPIAAAFLFLLPAMWAGKWNIAYQYDQDESSLFLRAIVFPSDQRGIAAGVITEKGRQRPVALVTSDNGKVWDVVKLKEEPLSVACFTDEVCWISTQRGVWRSDEGGREWKKISDTKGIVRMHFASATRGWAAGARKSAWETNDGGRNWKLLDAAKELTANPDHAAFMAMAFQGQNGIIAGNSRPPRRDESLYPEWMVPEETSKRKEWPAVTMLLETRDAGKTWKSSTNSLFGMLTAIRMRADGLGAVALLEYFHSFEIPAEVLMIDFKTGRSRSIFRDKQVAVTDVLAGEVNKVWLAGVEPSGLRSLPIPQKVRFLEAAIADDSLNVLWTKLDVDYRVTARRVQMARQPNGKMWAITDTGMILRLDR